MVLTARGYGCPRRVMRLQDSGLEGAYGRGCEAARERVSEGCSNVWKRGSLAGLIEGCPRSRRRVRGVLRAVLRSTLRPV